MARRLREIALERGIEPEAVVLLGAAGEINRGWNWVADKPRGSTRFFTPHGDKQK